jgi:hypothetical protein
MIEAFLLGVIVMGCLTSAAFFLKFWLQTRDGLFLAFAIAFFVEALNRIALLFMAHPSEGRPEIYLLRLFVFLMLAAAIVNKNRKA